MIYDAIILGGGPAGLSAAVYLGRFTRQVLVLDEGRGRSSMGQHNENYLGFPDGISTLELRERGRKQAERFGAHFRDCIVQRIERVESNFRAYTSDGDFEGRTLLFATGVTDIWPVIPDIERWVGTQVFWCITCDGFRTQGKRIVCIGNTDDAAVTTLQFLLFTDQITLVADPEKERFCEIKREDLCRQGIPMECSRPQRLELTPDGAKIAALILTDGTRLPCDLVFSLLGICPNTQMARELGIAMDDDGYIEIDEEGYTNIPGVFAAGDLTRMYTQQISSAVHAGAEAAQTMNYYLYPDFQKNLKDVSPQEARGADPENQ